MARALVAYFSTHGTTAKVAEAVAEAAGADLFEIVPEVPYTLSDLNWQDKSSRSTREMSDRSSRPAIAGEPAAMADYDTVFVGFPIWWYREPSIIDTFLESYDLAGKTLVPFCTSGSSGIGSTADNFRELAPAATVLEGRRFAGGAPSEEVAAWVQSL